MNVIDNLVVTLGLDPKPFQQGQAQSAASLKKLREDAAGTAKEMQASGKRAAEMFSAIKTEVLSLAGVLLGTAGIGALTATSAGLRQLGKDANSIGLPVGDVAAFAQAIQLLEGKIADCEDVEGRAALQTEMAALAAKMRRIPYIDPIDVRYRRFENVPKPIAQAVMFCLMDVSGSMSEHMKDLAKRFYMLLYIFLTRRYRHVEIVFIRHTDRAEEVDEQTFFHSPATGGTVVSSAFETMKGIVAARYRPQDWNIYAAQASDGDNSYGDGEITAQLLRDSILPVTQYFAYLEVGDEDEPRHGGSNSSLWGAYENLRAEGQPLAMRKVNARGEIFPVFRELFQRRQGEERVAS